MLTASQNDLSAGSETALAVDIAAAATDATTTTEFSAPASASVVNSSLASSAIPAIAPSVAVVPLPLTSRAPLGSLIYDASVSDSISVSGGASPFTVNIDPGQTISIVATPASGSVLQPTIELKDPANVVIGSATAAASRQSALIQTVPTTTGGTYTITVGGAAGSTGTYTLRLVLNAALEAEGLLTGVSNNSTATAQNIDTSAVSLGGASSRLAVLGTADTDFYAFTLAAGDTATLVLTSFSGGSPGLTVLSPSGDIQALGTPTASNLGRLMTDYLAPVTGTYFVSVTGSSQPYSLLVTRNAEFDTEPNDSVVNAKPILSAQAAGEQRILGYLNNSFGSSLSINDLNLGSWDTSGNHSASYIVGSIVGSSSTRTARDYFVYNLPATPTILSADLTLSNPAGGYVSPDPTETFTLHDVSTPLALLQSGSSGHTEIYDDLGAGVSYGSQTVSAADNGKFVTIHLNGDALAYLNSHVGGLVALGGALTTISGSASQNIFGISSSPLARLVLTLGEPTDIYQVTASGGQPLQLSTSTPSDGSGQFVNTLDPRLRLLDSLGNPLAADDNSAPDGRNAVLTFTPPADGTYYVEVSSPTPSPVGEYVLSVTGNVPTPSPFQVVSNTPASGSILNVRPTSITIDFNDAVYVPSVQAADLLLDGSPVATAVSQVDSDTFRFTLPSALGNGTHVFSLAAGSVLDVHQTPLSAFSGSFVFDSIGPNVTATSILPGGNAPPGSLSYQVTFSEPMKVGNLSSDDWTLRGNIRAANFTPNSFSFDSSGTVLTLNYSNLPDDNYTLTLLSGLTNGTNFTDVAGNALDGEFTGVFPSGNGVAGGNCVLTFNLDLDSELYPTPMTAKAPLGSLIYDPTITRTIAFVGDTDTFTINLDPGQTISLVATPATGGSLRPTIELTDPTDVVLGSVSAAGPGQSALLQTVATTTGGTYSITIAGAAGSTGIYTLRLVLNAAVEAEGLLAGVLNNSLATAQNIDASAVSIGGDSSRLAVLGSFGGDFYSFTLAAGDTVTLAETSLAAGDTNLTLFGPSGVTQALGIGGPLNVGSSITDFVVPVSGTYCALVNGNSLTTYSLLVTRNTEFNSDLLDDTLGAAQPILSKQTSGEQRALGFLGGNGGAALTLSASTTGMWDQEGTFRPIEPDHFAGFDSGESSSPQIPNTYRNFFVFDLPPTSRAISGADLRIYSQNYFSLDPSETFSLFDVSTPLTDLQNGGAGQTPIFDDLGSGVSYGSQTISAADNGQYVTIHLDSDALAYFNSHVGGEVALGGAVTSISSNLSTQLLFFGGGPVQLALTYAENTDLYQVAAHAGQSLQIATSTPADGTGQFVNTLDPRVRVLDSTGNPLAADDNSAADGRNAQLNFVAPTSGIYYIELSPSPTTPAPTQGEYVLSVIGNTASAPPFRVASISPIDGARLSGSPTLIIVDFNDVVYTPSVQPSDLLVDGVAVATALSQRDGDTFSFTIPGGLGEGTHTFSFVAGAILDQQQTPLDPFTSTFIIDKTAPRVTATSIAPNGTAPPGSLSYQVTFNEPMRTSVLADVDFQLFGQVHQVSYTPDSFFYDVTGTIVTLNFSNLPEDSYTLTLLSLRNFQFPDVAGNALDGEFGGVFPSGDGTPGGNFVIEFSLDVSSEAYPTPITAEPPLGSLIHDPAVAGLVNVSGDTDTFTINVDPGQTISAVVVPQSAGLQPTLELRDPANALIGTASAAGPGLNALLQTIPAITGGTYTITVGGAGGSTGLYALQLTLNAALETETNDGPANDSLATAQDINASFIDLHTPLASARRGAVDGVTDTVGLPFEIEPNNSTGLADDASRNFVSQPSSNLYQLGIKGSISPANESDFYKIGQLQAGDVITISGSGQQSSRGSNPAPVITLYRGSAASPVSLGSASGNALTSDSLFYHFTITTTDTYYVQVRSVTAESGTYDLGLVLDNSGPAPATGGTVTTESEPNQSAATATDVSTSWRQVQYVSQTSAIVSAAGDNDFYAYQFTAGDLVTINVDSLAPSFDAQVSLRNSSGTVIASDNGARLFGDSPIYSYIIPATGTYFIQAASFAFSPMMGPYNLDVYLSTNSPPPVPLSGFDYYSFSLNAGESTTLALEGLSAGNLDLVLQDASGATLATGVAGATNLDRTINKFVAPSTGTYYARVSGDGGVKYNLVATRNAAFDTENNDSFATSQSLDGTQGALGSVGSELPTPISTAAFEDGQDGYVVNNNFQAIQGGLWHLSIRRGDQPGHSAGTSFYYGIEALGNYSNSDSAGSITSPVITLPAVGVSKLSFNYVLRTEFSVERDKADVEISTDGFATYTTIASRATNLPTAYSWTPFTASLASLAGQSIQIRFLFQTVDSTNNGFEGWYVDDVQVTTTSPVSDEDWYSLDVASAGTQLRVETRTPADGSGQFDNNLNPHIELYDPSGALLASGIALGDGHNEVIELLHAPVPGDYRIRVTSEGDTHGEYFLGVTQGNQPPTVSNNLAIQSLQYSDPISPVTVSATDVMGDPLSASASFTKDGGPAQAGLPGGLTLNPSGMTSLDGFDTHTWSLVGTANVAPGVYSVTIAVTDGGDGSSTTTTTITVNPEDALATYTGPLWISTPFVNSSQAVIPLRAMIQDITQVNPAADPNPGVITHATVTFEIRDNATNALLATVANVPVSLIDPSESKLGTAFANWTANLGNFGSASYRIVTLVKNYYTNGTQTDNKNIAVITVSKPTTGSVSGGGSLVLAHSSGQYAGDPGSRAKISIEAKPGEKGAALKGNIDISIVQGSKFYEIKSKVISSLVVNMPAGHAQLIALASLYDVTNAENPVLLASNLSLDLAIIDNGEPGSADTLGITLWGNSGRLLFSSNWNGLMTVGQSLREGNLQVHDGDNENKSDKSSAKSAPATNGSLLTPAVQIPASIMKRIATEDLNNGSLAQAFKDLAHTKTPQAQALLLAIDQLADELGLDDILLDSLISGLSRG